MTVYMLMCPYCSGCPDAAVAGRAARRITPDLLRCGVRGLAATLACAWHATLYSVQAHPCTFKTLHTAGTGS